MTPSVVGVVRPTPAYYFPLVFFTSAMVVNLYVISLRSAPTSYVSVLGALLAGALLWTYLRYARTAELTATTLSWRGPLGSAEVPISLLTGVRSSRLKQLVVIECGDTHLRLPQGPAAKGLVEALQQLRPDLTVEGRMGMQFWVNSPIQVFRQR
ncbi:hypothetical protein ACFO0M_21570 [Micromonospora mangrovi]|uniref:Uncharacterized protein n=2 Tax=Micromonospora TaxID=1873 RepID=A0AAU8HA35_9ACTN